MGNLQVPKPVVVAIIIIGALVIGYGLMTGEGVGCDRIVGASPEPTQGEQAEERGCGSMETLLDSATWWNDIPLYIMVAGSAIGAVVGGAIGTLLKRRGVRK